MVPAAMEAVRQWTFTPATAGTTQIDVPFSHDGSQGMAGVIGGVPGGVYGGVPGGVRGGIVGGVPGGGPPPPPPPQGIDSGVVRTIKMGGGAYAAKLRSKVDPVYPAAAREADIQGDVVLEISVNEDGTVERVRPTEGHPLLAAAAMDAVMEWTYQPTLLNGTPVRVISTVTVPFRLK
jgi:protein TonB